MAVHDDAAVGKIDEANDKHATTLWIVDTCEAEKQAVIDKLTKKPWYAFWR